MKLIFAVLCVTQWWALGPLHVLTKRQFFCIYICSLSISIDSWDSLLLLPHLEKKQTDAIWKLYFRIRLWTCYRLRHAVLRRLNKFYPNWTITERVMTLCRFLNMMAVWRPYRRKSTFAFRFYDVSHLGRQRTIWVPNFDQISQSMADIITTSGCWKQTSAVFKFYFPVSTMTSSPSSVCDSAPDC